MGGALLAPARWTTRLGTALCGLSLVTGCTTVAPSLAAGRPSGPPASSAASAAVARRLPARPAGSGEVIAAYRRFWVVVLSVEALPQREWRRALSEVAVDPVLTRVYDGLRTELASGSREYGAVVPRPAVVDLRDGRASILDCQDASRSGVADVKTGLPTTAGDPRTSVAATLVRGGDGVWRLAEARYLPGPC